MATASVEFGPVDLNGQGGSSINCKCVYRESLTVSGSAAPMTNGLTSAQALAGAKIARISTDTACFFAIGSTPDPTATAVNGSVTSAKRHLNAGASVEQLVGVGDKVSVVSAP
jgi:hypothetical protein